MILVVAAVAEELELLGSRLEPAPALGRRRCMSGKVGDTQVLAVVGGIGQANAAQATTAALEALGEGIAAVVNIGCGGAYPSSGLGIGDVAVATELVFADLGLATDRGLVGFERLGMALGEGPEGPVYDRLGADSRLCEALGSAGVQARGGFATVERISASESIAREVARRTGAIVEEMEGAAVGLVALHYHKPFAALRGISNIAGARELNLLAGALAAQRLLIKALEEGRV